MSKPALKTSALAAATALAPSGSAVSGRTDRDASALVYVPARAREDRFPASARIVVEATANPKKANSNAAVAFDLYAGAKTVGEYVAALAAAKFPKDYARKTLAYDTSRGFVKIETAK